MIKVEFLQKGSVVYAMLGSIVTQYRVKDVILKVLDTNEVEVNYKLQNMNSDQLTHLDKDQVFSSKEELKTCILKQFDDPKTEEVGNKEEQKEIIS